MIEKIGVFSTRTSVLKAPELKKGFNKYLIVCYCLCVDPRWKQIELNRIFFTFRTKLILLARINARQVFFILKININYGQKSQVNQVKSQVKSGT